MAPLVVRDKVLVGNSGGEFGVRGCLTALDANNGKIIWRAYSTGPDADCSLLLLPHSYSTQTLRSEAAVVLQTSIRDMG